MSRRRDLTAARQFFVAAIAAHGQPDEVITDPAPALARAVEELAPDAFHNTGQHANNRIECDHGRLKARLKPMRGITTDRGARTVIRGQPSSRTSAEATTNSAPKLITLCG